VDVHVTVVSDQSDTGSGLILALRRAMEPLLLVVLPLAWLVMTATVARDAGLELGFDFRGTLWEPARAILHGGAVYAAPTSEGVAVGNPSVYPPLFILLATPFALVPVTASAWLWVTLLAMLVAVAMWIVGTRDWRLHVLVLASPVVVQGLLFGNLTLALMVPLALAWRYRNVPWIAGAAVAVAVAAKLLAWPLVLWLFFTRRFKAGFVSLGLAVALVIVPWALIGFEGFRQYPDLLREVQEMYAKVSLSVASVAAGLGASSSLAVALTGLAGLGLVAVAWWAARRVDGDRRSYAAAIGACIVAAPIVWPNYAALLFLPIAITWRRPSPAWFFGYAIWLAALLPRPTLAGPIPCCKPAGMPETLWIHINADPAWGYPAGTMAVVLAVVVALVATRRTETVVKPGPVGADIARVDGTVTGAAAKAMSRSVPRRRVSPSGWSKW
jgi:Glycosyltransferase family 87